MFRNTMPAPLVHLATVCLERNRWGNRQPSFEVSTWMDQWKRDGFAGIELWEFHYQSAGIDEQQRLTRTAAPLAIYNTYAGFGDAPEQAQHRLAAANAIDQLDARAVKYNLGHELDRIETYRRNLLAWADQLPASCRLLCECHPGTVLEKVDDASRFFTGLDEQRFGIITHLMDDPAPLQAWLSEFGPRVQHLHLQRRSPETDPATDSAQQTMKRCVQVLKDHGYTGSASIEFTRGIGKNEQFESLYRNALADQALYLNCW